MFGVSPRNGTETVAELSVISFVISLESLLRLRLKYELGLSR